MFILFRSAIQQCDIGIKRKLVKYITPWSQEDNERGQVPKVRASQTAIAKIVQGFFHHPPLLQIPPTQNQLQ